MKISSVEIYKNILKSKTHKNEYNSQNNQLHETSNPLSSYSQNYYVSFKARDFATVFEIFKDTEMPTTVRDYAENQRLLSSDSEYRAFCSKGLKNIQQIAFSQLVDCKTVADIKAKYPNEEDFKDLKPLDEIETRSKFFHRMQQLERSGVKTLSCEEDVTTFLVKKVYYEGKTYKEVMNDLKSAITPEAEELKEQLESYTIARGTFFLPIGLKVPNGATYGGTLQSSDPNALKNYKPLKNLTPEEVTDKIQKLLSGSEKSRYSMMDAWNHCEAARLDLSNFLTENYNNPKFSSLLSGEQIDIFDGNFYTRQHNLMVAFWKKYPQHKEALGEEIKVALERFDRYKGMGAEKFEKYKEFIRARSQEIRDSIQLSKINPERDFPNATELIRIISQTANPMSITSDSANEDFAQLLLKRISFAEFQTLQGDDSSSEYQELIPDGIKEKIRSLLKSPQYTNLSNAQNIAILQYLLEEGILDENAIISIINDKKPFSEIIKEIVSNESEYTKCPTINTQNVNTRYNENKRALNSSELAKIKEELLSEIPDFNKDDNLILNTLLRTQGKYLKTILGDNCLKPLVQTLFWNEFDRINGTHYSSVVINNINFDKTIEDAIESIDNISFSDIVNIDW